MYASPIGGIVENGTCETVDGCDARSSCYEEEIAGSGGRGVRVAGEWTADGEFIAGLEGVEMGGCLALRILFDEELEGAPIGGVGDGGVGPDDGKPAVCGSMLGEDSGWDRRQL